MQIDAQTLDKIAHLSRLSFSEAEKAEIQKDLHSILNWMEQLDELDTENVAPTTYMGLEVNKMREDVSRNLISHEEGLKNAPKRDSDYFRVPKVIE